MALNALVLLGFSELLDSFTLDGPGAALGTAIVLGLVNGGLNRLEIARLVHACLRANAGHPV